VEEKRHIGDLIYFINPTCTWRKKEKKRDYLHQDFGVVTDIVEVSNSQVFCKVFWMIEGKTSDHKECFLLETNQENQEYSLGSSSFINFSLAERLQTNG
jgi:hypothetical protein